jgi:hypothetical protein
MVFSISEFDYLGKLQYAADISSLSQGGKFSIFHRIYNDACDEGFTVKSFKTNIELEMVLDRVDEAGNGSDREIQGWNFIPTATSARKYPMFKNMKILVVNT